MSFAAYDFEEMKPLSGGVSAAVVRMNGADIVHGAVLGDVLYRSLKGEAKSHQASFESGGFNKVMELAKAKKIRVHLVVVALKDSLPKFAGCTVQFPTVLTEWTGKEFYHYPAVYAEDFCVSSEMSAEFKKQTTTQEYPHGLGLGAYFECERTKSAAMNLYGDLPNGNAPAGLVVEHGAENKAAIRLLNKFGANIEEGSNNTVLQFNSVTAFSKQALMPVQIGNLRISDKGTEPQNQSNMFVVSWAGADKKQQVAASFTEALSTFTGKPVVRVQMTSNGELVRGPELTEAITSLFAAGQEEVFKRKWIPDLASAEEAALFLRIHAVHEPIIAATIQEMGGSKRLLGSNEMLPAVVKFSDILPEKLGIKLPASSPFDVLVRSEETEKRPETAPVNATCRNQSPSGR